jgi:asparagine synthase (glutamine-hydrolysing)
VLIFNGEIYNHEELRDTLKDIQFKGHSDTETILYYLIKKGADGLKDLNGIFALALLDISNSKLLLARDQFGIKPLYYFYENQCLIFSSELKAILPKLNDHSLNYSNLYTFLRLRYNPSPQTLFKKIKKLLPGHFLEVNINGIKINESALYGYMPGKKINIKENEALEGYEHYLRRAIKRQLMADVPISILLSGGVDSALLTKIAIEVSGDNFHTYTAGYSEKSEIDEIEEAKLSASYLGTYHHEVIIDQQDFSACLPKFISIIEEPLGSQSIVPMFYLSEQIHKDGFKVTLSGQGVDEPWAGYPKYNPQSAIDFFSKFFGDFNSLRKLSSHDQYRRALNAITSKDIIERFIEINSVFDFKTMNQLMKDQALVKEGENTIRRLFEHRFEILKLCSNKVTDSLMYFDTRMNLADDLLLYTDKISMFHSLEVRVPYLDTELVQYVESLPAKFKVDLRKNKMLHKKLAEKYLPAEIVHRKKKHFATPRKAWFKGEMGMNYEEMIIEDKGAFSQIIDKNVVKKFFDDHRKGVTNYEKQLYLIISLYLWQKEFL